MTSSELLRWLFGLDVIPEGAEGLQLAWQYPPAAWGWFFIFTSAILVFFGVIEESLAQHPHASCSQSFVELLLFWSVH